MTESSNEPYFDDRTIGHRIRRIRNARRKSLRVVAELAGITASTLSRIETGQLALDSRKLTVRLANALGVAPQDLTGLVVPAPGNPRADAGLHEVRAAVQAVTLGVLDAGHVQPVEQLTARVQALADVKQACHHDQVAAALPTLILDLHASIDAGRNVRELLQLAVHLHHAGTQAYLQGIGAPADLCWAAARLAGDAAEQLDEAVPLGVAAFGMANGLLGWGSFGLAQSVLDRSPVSPGEDAQLAGMLALTHSLVATTTSDTSGARAALEQAAELAERTGEGNNHWMSFGPTNVAAWRLSNALEAGDYGHARKLVEQIHPDRIAAPTRRANFYLNRARTAAQTRGSHAQAVWALRQAELISEDKVQRNPLALDLLSELHARAPRDAAARELRGMMYRAGLPV